MIEVFINVMFFFFGYVVGWKFREFHAIKNMNDIIDSAQSEINEKAKENVIEVFIETHDNQIFVYNKSTSEYMAHASNKQDLEKMLMKKYPGKTFNTSVEDINRLNGKNESI